MDGDDLRVQANTIDVSEKDTGTRISRKLDLIIFYLADVVETSKKTCGRLDELEDNEKSFKNKAVGAGIILTTLGAGIVWILDKVFK